MKINDHVRKHLQFHIHSLNEPLALIWIVLTGIRISLNSRPFASCLFLSIFQLYPRLPGHLLILNCRFLYQYISQFIVPMLLFAFPHDHRHSNDWGCERERETNEACHNCLSSVLGNKSASRKFEPTNMWFQVLGPYSPAIFKNGLISIILYI